MPEHGVGELGGCRERLVVVAERVPEEVVHGREHLRPRAVVAREREQVLRLLAALAEDLEIRVAEPVDRLELVADGEDLGVIRVRDEVDQLALEPVRVLELVDHDHPEAELRRLTNSAVVAQQIAGRELEILEVHDRLAPLRGGVLRAEALEQLLEEVTVVRGELLERSALDRLPRLLVRGRARTLAGEGREIDEPLGRRADVATRRSSSAFRCCVAVADGSAASASASAATPRRRRRRSAARRARGRGRDPPSAASRRRR